MHRLIISLPAMLIASIAGISLRAGADTGVRVITVPFSSPASECDVTTHFGSGRQTPPEKCSDLRIAATEDKRLVFKFIDVYGKSYEWTTIPVVEAVSKGAINLATGPQSFPVDAVRFNLTTGDRSYPSAGDCSIVMRGTSVFARCMSSPPGNAKVKIIGSVEMVLK